MSQNPQHILEQVFGFKTFHAGQEAVIARLLQGKSVLAIFPTGGGKSLCYQLPALLFSGLTLVISPLIALMKDQIDFLLARGVAAARLDSSLTLDETRQVYQDLDAGRTKLLYVSPVRFNNERFLQALQRWSIAMLAIDEVHCISAWGHNFRPDYLKIANLAKQWRVGCILGLTATATPAVAQDITQAFTIRAEDVVHTGFYRPNLYLRVTPVGGDQRQEMLLRRLRTRPPGSAIVYVTLQQTAMEVAAFLARQQLDAHPYHAGMETAERNRLQDAFMASDQMIIVATIAFGMGVDKANIRAIYHYNLPKGLESYAQEIGRAGRDGKPAHCELLFAAEDTVVLENFTYGDTPTPTAIHACLHEVLSLGPRFDVSLDDLAKTHDIRLLVIKTLFAYLELAGILQSTGPFYTEYRFQPQKPSQEILARFDANRASFLGSIFRLAKPGRTWFSLDIDSVSRAVGQPRQRIVAAMDYLEQHGDLVLQVGKVRQGYRLCSAPPMDRPSLEAMLNARFQKREEQDIARVQTMLAFATHAGCLTQFLLAYFGEQRAPCGHCARCQGEPLQPLPGYWQPPLDHKASQILKHLHAEGHPSLAEPRQLTRFLCGLASPATMRLRHHSRFGIWAAVPFLQVLAFVQQHTSGKED